MRAILRACLADPRWEDDEEYVARRVAASMRPGAWESIARHGSRPPTSGRDRPAARRTLCATRTSRCPALGFADAQDRLKEPGYQQAMDRIPGARIEVFEDAGHLLNIEQAERFKRLTLDFLLGLDPASTA